MAVVTRDISEEDVPGNVTEGLFQPIENSAIISAYPVRSGLGTADLACFRLGLIQDQVLFKINRRHSEAGYTKVVRGPFWSTNLDALLSTWLPTPWRRFVSQRRFVQFGSPHFFHLGRFTKFSVGVVHDVDWRHSGSVNASPSYNYYMSREMKAASQLSHVVCVSQVVQEQLTKAYPKIESTVIQHWNDARFKRRDRGDARRRLGLPHDRIILLSVGSELYRKNLEILPRVMNMLGPEFLLLRVGPSSSISSRIKPSQICVIPEADDKRYPFFFNSADVLLATSTWEGFGRPVIEAVSSGLPVVASAIPAFKETLGTTYPYLIDPKDPGSWIEPVRELACDLRAQEGLLEEYSLLAEKYSENRAREEYRRLYRSIGITD